MEQTQRPWKTVSEVHALTGISINTINQAIRKNYLAGAIERAGNTLLIDVTHADYQRWLDRRTLQPRIKSAALKDIPDLIHIRVTQRNAANFGGHEAVTLLSVDSNGRVHIRSADGSERDVSYAAVRVSDRHKVDVMKASM